MMMMIVMIAATTRYWVPVRNSLLISRISKGIQGGLEKGS